MCIMVCAIADIYWVLDILTNMILIISSAKLLKQTTDLEQLSNDRYWFIWESKDVDCVYRPWGTSSDAQYHSLFSSVQFRSVTQSCLTLCDPMNCSTPGLPVHHQLLEFTQICVHLVGDAIQPFHPLLSPSPPAPNPSQHQGLSQSVNSSHEVAKVLEFQL